MVAESLTRGELVEVFARDEFPQARLVSPMAYWVLVAPHSAQRPEVQAFADWLLAQAVATRAVPGVAEGPEPAGDGA